jgi:peptidoglycan/LPS O-acetylase OafA/YrhL
VLQQRFKIVLVAEAILMAAMAVILALQGLIDQQVVGALAGSAVVAVGGGMGVAIWRTRDHDEPRAERSPVLNWMTVTGAGLLVSFVVILVVWLVERPAPNLWIVGVTGAVGIAGLVYCILLFRRPYSSSRH